MEQPRPLSIGEVAWSYFRDRPWVVVLYVLLSFYYPIRVVLTPFLVGRITSELGKADVQAMSLPLMQRTAGWIVIGWVVALAMRTALGLLDAHLGPYYHIHVRNQVLDNVLYAYRRNYQEIETGDVLVKLFDLPETCYRAARKVRNGLIPTALALVCGLVAFAVLNRTLMWIYIGFLVVLGLMFVAVAYVLYRRWIHAMEERDRLHEDIDDFLGNLFSLYVTDTIEFEKERLQTAAHRYRVLNTQSWTRYAFFHTATTLLKMLFVAVMILAVGWMRLGGSITTVAPLIFVIFTLDTVLYSASLDYMDFMQEVCTIAKTQAFLHRVSQRSVAAPPPGRDERRTPTGRVVFRQVLVERDDRSAPILHHVNLVIEPQARVLVTGPIGGGKSTLLRLLAGLMPYVGSITIDGHEVRELSSTELKRAVTYIPQSPRLFNRTVLENILYGFDAAQVSADDVRDLLAQLRLPNFPPLDRVAGKAGSRLSGGQRTIVYLIRAFFRRTPIVILDEPTAALDPETKATVRRVTDRLFARQTLVVITHDFTVDWRKTQHIVVSHQTAVSA